MRQILFLAHQLEDIQPVRASQSNFELRDAPVERYEDVRRSLEQYGQVMREKTSGTFRRISTPPEGVPRPDPGMRHRVLVENPHDHKSTVEAHAHRQQDVIQIREAFFDAVGRCDALVAMAELESDTRGALIEHALGRRKPVLVLYRAGIKHALHPMYLHRESIMARCYKDKAELTGILNSFFQRVPLRSAV